MSVRGGSIRCGMTISGGGDSATQMPMQSNVLTIPLPPPAPLNVRVANPKAPSKNGKFFQPPFMPYFP